jgi:hypothetical protein
MGSGVLEIAGSGILASNRISASPSLVEVPDTSFVRSPAAMIASVSPWPGQVWLFTS